MRPEYWATTLVIAVLGSLSGVESWVIPVERMDRALADRAAAEAEYLEGSMLGPWRAVAAGKPAQEQAEAAIRAWWAPRAREGGITVLKARGLIPAFDRAHKAGMDDPLFVWARAMNLWAAGHDDAAYKSGFAGWKHVRGGAYPDHVKVEAALRLIAIAAALGHGREPAAAAMVRDVCERLPACVIELDGGAPGWQRTRLYQVLGLIPSQHSQVRTELRAGVEATLAAGGLDPWVEAMVKGRIALHRAWEARGTSRADRVTDERWKGFREHLTVAYDEHLRAWQLDPADVRPAEGLVGITAVLPGKESSEFWFQQVVERDPLDGGAYEEQLHYMQIRWGGSAEAQLAFGQACLDTERFDTLIPWYFARAITQIAWETGGIESPVWLDPRTWRGLDRLTASAIARATPAELPELRQHRLAFAVACHRYKEAEAIQATPGWAFAYEAMEPYTSMHGSRILFELLRRHAPIPPARSIPVGEMSDAAREMYRRSGSTKWTQAYHKAQDEGPWREAAEHALSQVDWEYANLGNAQWDALEQAVRQGCQHPLIAAARHTAGRMPIDEQWVAEGDAIIQRLEEAGVPSLHILRFGVTMHWRLFMRSTPPALAKVRSEWSKRFRSRFIDIMRSVQGGDDLVGILAIFSELCIMRDGISAEAARMFEEGADVAQGAAGLPEFLRACAALQRGRITIRQGPLRQVAGKDRYGWGSIAYEQAIRAEERCPGTPYILPIAILAVAHAELPVAEARRCFDAVVGTYHFERRAYRALANGFETNDHIWEAFHAWGKDIADAQVRDPVWANFSDYYLATLCHRLLQAGSRTRFRRDVAENPLLWARIVSLCETVPADVSPWLRRQNEARGIFLALWLGKHAEAAKWRATWEKPFAPADLVREWNPIFAERIEDWIHGRGPDPLGRMPLASDDEQEGKGGENGLNDF